MSISIRKLNKVYPNGNHALKDVCLEIPTGMFGLLGPNGAGKSTLMRILVALMEPTSGEVNICGYDLMRQRKEIRGVLGYLPQDFRFFAKYKTYEFLDYAARLSGMNCKSLRKNAVDEMLENVGLFDVRDRYANKLSGGMKRRLGIAQALIHHPKVIIVDEPTTGLAPEERIRFRNLLSEVSENDVTIILSTHIVSDVEYIADEILLMKGGKLLQQGSVENVARQVQGWVWELAADREEAEALNRRYAVSSLKNQGDKTALRIISEDCPAPEAVSVPPTLEDVYLYYFREEADKCC